jgi:cullin-associated NEDD8-dissociated protein 1
LCSLGQLIKIVNDNQMNYVVDQLVEFLSGKEDELRDIAGLGKLSTCPPSFDSHPSAALKTITSELPADGKTTPKTVEKLTPRLLKQLSTVRTLRISY